MADHVSIILAEPSPFLREKLAGILSRQADVWCVLQVSTAEGLLRGSAEHQPDLVLADLSLFADRSLAGRLRLTAPRARLVALVEYESRPYAVAAAAFGVDGIIAKDHLSEEFRNGPGHLLGQDASAGVNGGRANRQRRG